MDDNTSEAYVRHYIAANEAQNEVAFTWRGGKPTLLGPNFCHCAVALQARYGAGGKIGNSFQTSGMLLDDEWCTFPVKNHFLVGLPLGGLAETHNQYRAAKGGRSTHKPAMYTLTLLQEHYIDYSVLVHINRTSTLQPLQVYDFLCDAGIELIQSISMIECLADETTVHAGLELRTPGGIQGELMEWSVCPQEFGEFLVAIFDHRIKRDVDKISVMNIEWASANPADAPSTVCRHQSICGYSVIVERNGNVYACDHYIYP